MRMDMPFFKYQGAGNDFVIVDQRDQTWIDPDNKLLVARLCDRRFGIGGDGLMLLLDHPDYDFEMVYFNADGRPGSMCGNGGRCIVAFAKKTGLVREEAHFLAVDGPHRARMPRPEWVELHMNDVPAVETGPDFYYLDTGSPHYVQFVPTLDQVDVVPRGRAIRYNDRFREQGTNVNFVERRSGGLYIATYERGVEDETLACGTGVTAAALVSSLESGADAAHQEIPVYARGGDLSVRFRREGQRFTDIWLCGPATFVFSGQINLNDINT
jgi:diaminopimelate epimerase